MQLDISPARRKRLSLTSLIDVIFLLLLFFILSSTFTQFTKVQVSKSGSGETQTHGLPQVFVRLGYAQWNVNGRAFTPEAGLNALIDLNDAGADTLLLVVTPDVDTQALVDAVERIRQNTLFQVTMGK